MFIYTHAVYISIYQFAYYIKTLTLSGRIFILSGDVVLRIRNLAIIVIPEAHEACSERHYL